MLIEMVGKNMTPGFRACEAILQGCAVAYSFEVKFVGADSSNYRVFDTPCNSMSCTSSSF